MAQRRKYPNVEVVIPVGARGDEWRARALEFVLEHYAREHEKWNVTLGTVGDDEPWSKGAAVDDAVSKLDIKKTDVLVIADADSYVTSSETMVRAVELVHFERSPWVTPHRTVYRLKQDETERLYEDRTRRPRIRAVVRTPYIGPLGGGITVLSPSSFRTVGGIDPRFEGWGGEDVAFGWMLETLAGRHTRLGGRLVHLWHPHPAPDLRGSPESEALVEVYKAARGHPRRCEALARREDWSPLAPLEEPVRFRMKANRRTLRLFGSDVILRFDRGIYETVDAEIAEALRKVKIVQEV